MAGLTGHPANISTDQSGWNVGRMPGTRPGMTKRIKVIPAYHRHSAERYGIIFLK
jgi:hypothetical protein